MWADLVHAAAVLAALLVPLLLAWAIVAWDDCKSRVQRRRSVRR